MTLGYSQAFALSSSPYPNPPRPLVITSCQVCPPKRCVPASPRLGARASPGPVACLGLLPGLLLPTPLPILAAPTSHLPPLKTRRQVRPGSLPFLGLVCVCVCVCVAFLGGLPCRPTNVLPVPPSTKEPRRPRIVNAWTEEVEELPWSSTSSGGSPGVSRLPRAVMLPGLG